MKKIYLVRHGQSTANANDTFGGGLDVPMTAQGHQQAAGIGKKIKAEIGDIDLIISSSMQRTRKTAELIADQLGYQKEQIEIDPRIVEVSSGDFEGGELNAELVQERDQHLLAGKNEKGVEPLEEIVNRVKEFADDVKGRPEEVILIVGHGFSGRFLRKIFAGLKPTDLVPKVGNAEIVQLYPYQEVGSGEMRL